jgi:hypothetical protein
MTMPEDSTSGWGVKEGVPVAPAAKTRLGQLSFSWLGESREVHAPAVPDKVPESPTLQAPVASSPTIPSPARPPGKVRRSLQDIVERYLREHGVPYIAVDEAKKALFAGAKMRSFHFVVYRPQSVNWLLWVGQLRKEDRTDLVEWEKIFGDGFKAMVVKVMKDKALKFRTLAGEAMELK